MVVFMEGAGHGQSGMAFSRLLCISTVDTSRGAGAMQVSMMSRVGATTMVLVVSMLAPTYWAYHHLRVFAAVLCCVVERPAMLALLDKGSRHKLTDMSLVPKHERRITGHVLQTGTILI